MPLITPREIRLLRSTVMNVIAAKSLGPLNVKIEFSAGGEVIIGCDASGFKFAHAGEVTRFGEAGLIAYVDSLAFLREAA